MQIRVLRDYFYEKFAVLNFSFNIINLLFEWLIEHAQHMTDSAAWSTARETTNDLGGKIRVSVGAG